MVIRFVLPLRAAAVAALLTLSVPAFAPAFAADAQTGFDDDSIEGPRPDDAKDENAFDKVNLIEPDGLGPYTMPRLAVNVTRIRVQAPPVRLLNCAQVIVARWGSSFSPVFQLLAMLSKEER